MENERIRIIVADDEPVTKMDLRELLVSAGYEVVAEASDGLDAVELCRQYRPDLILMDVKMPFLDGLSAARMIHEEGLAGAIIMLTAYSERDFIDRAKSCGVGGYLVKPIDEKSLVPSIELAIARSQELRQLRKDMETRYFDAPDLKELGDNAYRFINAVSDFATHADPIRRTKNYKENLFMKTYEGNPMIDRAYQIMRNAA